MSDRVGSFSSGDAPLPATFRGTARLLDGAETPAPPRPARHDDLPGRFEAELDISFPLLVGLGYRPVDPSHAAYPLYLAASAAHERTPPATPAPVIDRHAPDAVVMPFETTVIVTEAMALRHGLVAPGRAGSAGGIAGQGPPVRRKPVPPPMARSIPLAAAHGSRSTGRFDMNRLANIDLSALGLGDALRSRPAAGPGAPFVRAPFAGPGPAAAEDDFPALAGATPSSGTGRRALDIVMTPGAAVPPAMRAAVGAAGGSRAGQGSATSAGPSGADANGDVLAMLQGMREADRSPRPSGSVEVAQAGGSDVATLPRAGGQPAVAPLGHPSTISVPPASLRVSNSGRAFIEKEEELPGVSNTLYHPSAASGVTLGPGYDMKEKSADQIVADLERIDVAPDVAKKISGASHLSPQKIRHFIKDNRTLVNLTSDQQARLLASAIGPYEAKVRRDITVPLKPNQFDALVSFLYNPGHGWPAVRDAVNRDDFPAAALAMMEQTKSGGKALKDLIKRRHREADLLLTGNYGTEE